MSNLESATNLATHQTFPETFNYQLGICCRDCVLLLIILHDLLNSMMAT